MADEPSSPARPESRWPVILLLSGAAFMAVAAVTVPRSVAGPENWPPALLQLILLLRVAPLLIGTGLLAHAVVERLCSAEWDFPARVETAVYTSVAGGAAALIAFGHALATRVNPALPALGLPEEWDSFRLFYAGAFLLLMTGTILILLPTLWRKVALSAWILFHFLGMFSVFSSIDPPNATGPWLAKQLWTVVYRPYLSFFYLTNAYHFYSPDPGPPALLWFAVHYDDGTYSWIKLPSREKSPIGMHYQRVLALPEHSFSPTGRLAYTEAERLAYKAHYPIPPERTWEKVYARRYTTSPRFKHNGLPIPQFADIDLLTQYREPNDTSQMLVASVARRVLSEARSRPWEGDAGKAPADGIARPRTIKMYRLVHQCLTPGQLAEGKDPYAKNTYWGYFIGEFDADGKLLDLEDPYLYWYLPILYVPPEYPHHQVLAGPPVVNSNVGDPKGWQLLDCLEMHASGMIIDDNLGKKPGGEKKEKK